MSEETGVPRAANPGERDIYIMDDRIYATAKGAGPIGGRIWEMTRLTPGSAESDMENGEAEIMIENASRYSCPGDAHYRASLTVIMEDIWDRNNRAFNQSIDDGAEIEYSLTRQMRWFMDLHGAITRGVHFQRGLSVTISGEHYTATGQVARIAKMFPATLSRHRVRRQGETLLMVRVGDEEPVVLEHIGPPGVGFVHTIHKMMLDLVAAPARDEKEDKS